MKMSEVREKSKTELESLLSEKKVALKQLEFKVATSGLKNVKELSKVRKDIARILTALKVK